MKITRQLLSGAIILFGEFLVIYGGYDDSPGAQFLGVVLALLGFWGVIKSRKKNNLQ